MKDKIGTAEEISAGKDRAYSKVIGYLKALIEEDKIRCGSRIPSEREMAAYLGLGRNSVREALRMMEYTGILESRQGKGNFLVNRPERSLGNVFSMMLLTGQSSFEEVSSLRRVLETEALQKAVCCAGTEEIQKINGAAEKMKAAMTEKTEEQLRKKMAEADREFHRALVQAGGSHLLQAVMESLEDICNAETVQILQNSSRDELQNWCSLHEDIYCSLKEKKSEEGAKRLKEHYDRTDQAVNFYKKEVEIRRMM